jgi:hypothetical protein
VWPPDRGRLAPALHEAGAGSRSKINIVATLCSRPGSGIFKDMSNSTATITPQIPGTTDCSTCYGTTTVDQGGKEINCPDCPIVETFEMMAVTTIWQNVSGREFSRTKSYRAAWVADAMDLALGDMPESCNDIVDQYLA